MERSGRRVTALAALLATPVPLTSRLQEGRYWCDPAGAGDHCLAARASVHELDPFGCDEGCGDVRWSCVDVRSGH